MASLSSSCTLFTTTNAPTSASSNSSPHHLFAKASYFFTHAKTTPRFRVSCNAKNGEQNMKDGSERKVDRRNILFGLGGLYGASNLASNPLAMAEPITPPELDKCATATDWNSGKKLDINCCPPVTQNIIDYKLPPVPLMRVRPSADRVTPENEFLSLIWPLTA